MAKKRRAKAGNKLWKVYLVTSTEAEKFYIGMTSKEGTALDNYFGSNKESSSWPDREKSILYETERKSEAKFV